MLGAESSRRTLKAEDDLNRRTQAAYHKLLHGGEDGGDQKPSTEDDEMGHIVLGEHIVLGDVITQVPNKGLGTFAKVAVVVGLIGTAIGGAVGGALLIDSLTEDKPPVVIPGEIRDFEIGEAIVE